MINWKEVVIFMKNDSEKQRDVILNPTPPFTKRCYSYILSNQSIIFPSPNPKPIHPNPNPNPSLVSQNSSE
jgi:hypothetical protein